jgi:hypothetical protein
MDIRAPLGRAGACSKGFPGRAPDPWANIALEDAEKIAINTNKIKYRKT